MSSHWALPSRAYATADGWGGDVDVRHFAREVSSPSVRLIVQTDLGRPEVERLVAEVVDAVFEGGGRP